MQYAGSRRELQLPDKTHHIERNGCGRSKHRNGSVVSTSPTVALLHQPLPGTVTVYWSVIQIPVNGRLKTIMYCMYVCVCAY